LKAVTSAAYRAGVELEDGAEIIHDYTQKGGVIYKEIILPEGAPEEYRDRQTLWNRIDRRLNIIPEESFQKVIENLPEHQAQILTTIREQAKERQRLIEAKKERECERDRKIERSR
jgi:hypothetical protein